MFYCEKDLNFLLNDMFDLSEQTSIDIIFKIDLVYGPNTNYFK